MTFKLYSETNPEALKELKPDLGFRSWDELSIDDTVKIWIYLDSYFFKKNIKLGTPYFIDNFKGNDFEKKTKSIRIMSSIYHLNEMSKAKSYGKNYLEEKSLSNACKDFYDIFVNQNQFVVYQLLSIYCKAMISQSEETFIQNYFDKKGASYEILLDKSKWGSFDNFMTTINEIFSQFGLDVVLTRAGFIPRQEEKITEDIYKPVLNFFSDSKWKSVNQLLSEAFIEYRKNTDKGFSVCVTHTASAIQAYLQILVHEEIGKGDIGKLISQAQTKGLIPNDSFTKTIFKNMESIFMQERQETSVAHPIEEYATEKNARLLLNLSMVFFQHCIQN